VHGIVVGLTARAIACYADKAYISAGGPIGTPYKRKKHRRPSKRKAVQPAPRQGPRLRRAGHHHAKQWQIFRKARWSPSRLTAVVQAILALHHQTR
jgi:hypothetical protein